MSDDRTSGVYILLEDKMENVMTQLNNVMNQQLEGADPRAISFASTLLAKSMAFTREFANYVTFTLAELETAGFIKNENWFLLSNIIYRMFAIDFTKERVAVSEGLDINKTDIEGSRKVLARRAL